MDATNLYGHSVTQLLPYDEIEMWHGHSHVFLNKLEEISNTPDDNGIGYLIEIELKYPDKKKKKQKTFHLLLKIKL